MHRLYHNTTHKTWTLNTQMYPWNSGAQGTTADATENVKIKMDYDGMRSVIMIY